MAHKQKGFTVVELMITIAIFGIVLLLFTFGALQISRNYQQANTKIQLATTTRLIHSDFTQELQFSGLDIVPTQKNNPPP
jgi:prepilin-type N-terminal cleavage/methylation domain-containing protein